MVDINNIEIKEGQNLKYSTYTPTEEINMGKVYVHDKYGGLWVDSVPISLLYNHGLDYRKLEVINETN